MAPPELGYEPARPTRSAPAVRVAGQTGELERQTQSRQSGSEPRQAARTRLRRPVRRVGSTVEGASCAGRHSQVAQTAASKVESAASQD